MEYKIAYDFTIIDPCNREYGNMSFVDAVKRKEADKNGMYLDECRRQGMSFSPIVFSAYGTVSNSAVEKIKEVLQKRGDLGSLALQEMNIVILKYGGAALRKYYGY